MDCDLWPDVYVGQHRNRPVIYKNIGEGVLSDSTLQVDTSRAWLSDRYIDHHGGAWGDFDGDCDDDLIAGTNYEKWHQLMVSDNGVFTDEARERLPSDFDSSYSAWFDFDRDGDADLFQGRFRSGYFRQRSDDTFDSNRTMQGCEGDWVMLSDLNGDDNVEYICFNEGAGPRRIFDTSNASIPFIDITSDIGITVYSTVDTAAADINNDTRTDLIFLRGATLLSGASQSSANRIEAASETNDGQTFRFRFRGGGTLTVTGYDRAVISETKVFDGENTVAGFNFIHDVGSDTWTVSRSSNRWQFAYLDIRSSEAMTDLVNLDLEGRDRPLPPELHVNELGNFVNRTATSGLAFGVMCKSVVTADFDNDMDIDLYFVCSGASENLPNRLFANNGHGAFTEVADAGGASGIVGGALADGAGIGESAATADFNNDGFIDLFVTNGMNSMPVRVGGGPHELMLNNGNDNHWIELQLRGTTSDSDAVGARVLATAGDITQVREQGGVYHRWSQNDDRIHFGLGPNTSAALEIRWPSGLVEFYDNVASDWIYIATEGESLIPAVLAAPQEFDAPTPTDACGSAQYVSDFDEAVFIYRDCASGLWALRTTASRTRSRTYSGTLVSDIDVTDLEGFSLESGDLLNASNPRQIEFSLSVANGGEDGIDFVLPPDATSCLSLTTPSDPRVLIGPRHLPVDMPVDLNTMQTCSTNTNAPQLSVSDVEVDENDGTGTFTVTADPAPLSNTTMVTVTTEDGSATAGDDYVAISEVLSFGPGEGSREVVISLLDDVIAESTESFNLRLTNPVNATVADELGTMTITDDDEPTGCGPPIIDPNSDRGVFIWEDCTQIWHLLATGGGVDAVTRYDGRITSSTGFSSVIGVGLESTDVVDTGNPLDIDYLLRMIRTGTDGVDFIPATGAQLCLENASSEPSALPTFIGKDRIEIDAPIDLRTLTACDNGTADPPAFSVVDMSIDENAGTAPIAITLTPAASTTTSVAIATRAETATANADFYGFYHVLTFAPGETEIIVNATIIDDAETEATEAFVTRLFNANGAAIGNAEGTVSIIDND